MNKTLIIIRVAFLLVCLAGSALVAYAVEDWWDNRLHLVLLIGTSIGAFTIFADYVLKGFSLRGLSALTFGLFIGWAVASFLSDSPLFEIPLLPDDAAWFEQTQYLARMAMFAILMYLGAVVALRGKDEFNLVIPYVRFVPHEVNTPLVVVDTSALIDGRIAGIVQSGFFGYGLVVPSFVLNELQAVADSPDPQRQAKGRKGIETLNALRALPDVDLRIHESQVDKGQKVDEKLVFLAQSIKAKLLTTDFNLAQLAEFRGVGWLNLNTLTKVMMPEFDIGSTIEVALVRPGREGAQAVGYLSDGSMVVINDGKRYLGKRVEAQVQSIIPSAGGKMVFAKVDRVVENAAD